MARARRSVHGLQHTANGMIVEPWTLVRAHELRHGARHMRDQSALWTWALSALLCSSSVALAQDPAGEAEEEAPAGAPGGEPAPGGIAPPTDEDPLAKFPWQREGTGALGSKAAITIPKDFRFLPAAEASRLVEAMGNLTSKEELGLIGNEDLSWFVVFFFDDVGYVKDDEKDELDAEKMATSMREGLVESNAVRRERGMTELNFDGWAIAPRYNAETKQLEWAQRLKSVDGVSVNYNTRVLGRRGVMRVILVCDPEQLTATLPSYSAMMSGFRFEEGEDYAAYRDGDKIAEFGLAALVVGGAGAVAAKTGLLSAALLFFKKGAKVIVLGVLAALAGLKQFFTGKKKDGDAPA